MCKYRSAAFLLKVSVFVYFILFSAGCDNAYDNGTVYGIWKGEYQDRVFQLVINTDNTCELTYFDRDDNSQKFITGDIEIDFSKKPLPLSIINIPQLNHSLHTIIELINRDSLRITEFSTRWKLRPVSFGENTTLILKRVPEILQSKPNGE